MTFFKNLYRSVVVVVCVILGSQFADAATYYVAIGGSDAFAGTFSEPFRSIGRGVRVLKPGDTLYVMAGTYNESLMDTIPGGTSWTSPVTIARYQNDTVIINANGSVNISIQGSDSAYIILDGLILENGYDGLDVVSGAHHVRFQNGEVRNMTRGGITCHAFDAQPTFSTFCELINLSVHDTGSSGFGHGIYLSGSDNLVEKCEIYNNKKWGVQIANGTAGGGANRNIVRNSRLYNNGALDGGGVTVHASDSSLVYNNLVYNNANVHSAIRVGDGAAATKVYNNTVYGNGLYGVEVVSVAVNAEIRNNIIYANGGTISNAGIATIISNNFTLDPQFKDVASKDFRLTVGSQAINSGVTLSAVKNDFGGTARPQDGAYDIGAFEYQSAVTGAVTGIAAPTNLRIVP